MKKIAPITILIIAIGSYQGIRSCRNSTSTSSSSNSNECVMSLDSHYGYTQYFVYDYTCDCFMLETTRGKADVELSLKNHTEHLDLEDIEIDEESSFTIQKDSQGFVILIDETNKSFDVKIIEGSYEDWINYGDRLVLEKTREARHEKFKEIMDDFVRDCRQGRIQIDDNGEEFFVIEGDNMMVTSKGNVTWRCEVDLECMASE